MSLKRWSLACVLLIMVAAMMGCKFSFTTANISNLKLSKDKGGSSTTSSFGSRDTIYALADVSNAPSKMKLKARLLIDKIEGYESGKPVPGVETTIDLPGSAVGTFTFSPPNAGWPSGSYKVEVTLLNEEGEQKDQKTETFSVTGG